MTQHKYKGTGVAITTPFTDDNKIDFSSLGKHIEFLLSNGINYLIVLGTTGEAVTMNEEEHKSLIDYIISKVNKQIPIIVGIGGNNTKAVIEKIQKTDFSNIDGILSVAPYYNKPGQEGLYQHYKAISEVCPVSIIVYNVPGRTGVNINAETIIRLAKDFKNIVAVKEASGNINQAMHIIQNKPHDFIVLSGEDALTLPLMAIGVEGVISVVANAYPKEFSSMVQYALNNDTKSASQLHYKLFNIIENLFVDGNPAGIKANLEILNICKNNLRLPLTKINDSTYKKLKELSLKIKS
ncbi:MAG: 4-hydroxy-tetrahydrodipicolinate synthase [Bacteroidales bacterium]|jgi:4-hydroxy-tetrahydrodipicolinate synthase|nr:4-hydroxy-tetrahydrodipicolinate synthase [Bacteroidales bacterium]